MDATNKDAREISDDDVMNWMQELINELAKEKGTAGGACSLEAIRNPIRRNILKVLEDRALKIDEISERLGVTGSALRYHLNFLESSCFIQIEGDKVDLTPGGVSVVRTYKRA